MTTTNTIHDLSATPLYTAKGISVTFFRTLNGFAVGVANLATGQTVVEHFTDFADLMETANRAEFAARASAL